MTTTVREAVAVFDSEEALEQSIEDLESHGFDRAEISLLAGEGTVEEKLGHRYRRAEDAVDVGDDPHRFGQGVLSQFIRRARDLT